jgi:hypothetical protein
LRLYLEGFDASDEFVLHLPGERPPLAAGGDYAFFLGINI